MPKRHVTALKRAIEIAGGQAKLAAAIREDMDRPSVSQQTISYWLRNESLIEAEWWPAIERVTENKVTRKDLRPDVFGKQAA